VKCFRQVICRQECHKVPSWYLPSQAIGVNLALFTDNPCLYATRHKEGNVLRKVQRWLSSMAVLCKWWNIEINEDKTLAIYFSHQIRPPESLLTLNVGNIPFVNSVKYLHVIFSTKITFRLYVETVATKVRLYSLFRIEQLSTNIKLTLQKSL
jgi:hypothetical protein